MKPQWQQVRFSLGGSFTPVVRVLLWINGLTFVFLKIAEKQEFTTTWGEGLNVASVYSRLLTQLLGLVPHSVTHDLALWQPITYMFIHRDFMHFLMNMLALWWFGSDVERLWGSRKFLRYYFLTGIGAALTAIVLSWNATNATIGASGAVFGLLLAFGMLFPERIIYLYLVIPVKAKYCVAAFGALELLLLVWAEGDGVSHIAHVGGMFFGLAYFGVQRYGTGWEGIWRRVQKHRMRRKLRLIRKKDTDDQDPYGKYSKPTLH